MAEQEPEKPREVLQRLLQVWQERQERPGQPASRRLLAALAQLKLLAQPELLALPERELLALLEEPELLAQLKLPERELLALLEQTSEQGSAAPISLYFDLDNFSSTDIVDIIGLLSELYADIGGDGLVIDDVTLLDFQPALVPVEG